ncbi:hypothetical protein Lpp123_08752, partial [Lacticaseibacillus paracasei subsp. paracasei Lpp123]
MKKIWLSIAGVWLISVIYFIVYLTVPAMQVAVNASGLLSLVHGVNG